MFAYLQFNRFLSRAFRGMWLLALVLLFLAGVLAPHRIQAEDSTVYVAPLGVDTSSCGTMSSPCQSIQYAINQASSGDIILVAAGTYTYKPEYDICSFLMTRSVVCFVDKQLTILGGYSTTDWSNSNPEENVTIIDGQRTYRGVAVVAYSSVANLRMEGFTIRDGQAKGASCGSDWDTFAFGGGMWAQNSSVTLRDLIFDSNVALGGNTTSAYGGAASGGALAIQSPSAGQLSVLERVTFRDNRALGGTGIDRGGLALGGGLYTYQAAIIGDDLTFTDNLAKAGDSTGDGLAGGLFADALGGAAAFQQESQVDLRNVVAKGNQAMGGHAGSRYGTNGGGGFGGAIHAEETSLDLSDAQIEANLALGGEGGNGGVGFGGGLELLNSNLMLERIRLVANQAESGGSPVEGGTAGSAGGGGGYIWSSKDIPYQGQIVNAVFANNRIKMASSGSNRFGGGGGGLVVQGMAVEIIHSTFAGNEFAGDLKSGQAILVQKYGDISGSLDLRYSIISDHLNLNTDNTSALTVSEGNRANLYQGVFCNNTNDTNLNGLPLPPGIISGLDTMMYVSSIGFVSPEAPNYDYHITSNSPVIDRALDSRIASDIDEHPRPYGNVSDVGADEYVRPRLNVSPEQVILMVEDNAGAASSVYIESEYAEEAVIDWTATATASWLYLGSPASSVSKRITGQTEEILYFWLDPTGLELGTYEAEVLIDSEEADSTILRVQMIKVDQLFRSYIPLAQR
jgi:hypothetical protein